jgi:SepF-like predicted cell division protein (DUF552 family)
MVANTFLNRIFKGKDQVPEADYLEIDLGKELARKTKVLIRPFILKTFDDVNKILEILREGYTIALIDIKPLKSKDIVELKRAISKIKKTCDALEGEIAGFGENVLIATPSFAEIYKAREIEPVTEKHQGM